MQITVRSSLTTREGSTLDNLMRVYSSAKRYAYNRLLEGNKSKNELKKEIQYKFNINARYAYAAIEDAKMVILSQKKLLPIYVNDLKSKIDKSNKKLKKAIKKKLEPIKIIGIKNRINQLQNKLQEYKEHLRNKTIPKMVFGGRRTLLDLQKGKISTSEWKELRSNQLYSIGGKHDGGNQNLRLEPIKDNIFDLRINVGDRKWIHGTVKVPRVYLKSLLKALQSGIAYTIRLIRKNHKYYCHISYEEINNVIPNNLGIAGIDLNPEKIAVTIVKPDGNFVASKNFPCHAVTYARTNKRDWIIGNTIKDIYEWINGFGVNTIVIESLKFNQDHDTNKKFNRITHNFAFQKMANTIKTRALKEDFAVKEVPSAYTSVIGKLKYKDTYGLSDHQSAALVIGRRALGYTEKVPKALKKISPRAGLYFKSCQWKDKIWRSIARWMPVWNAVKGKLTHFFKTYDKGMRKHLLGSGGYTALQYVLLRQWNINLRRPKKTVNAGVPGAIPGTRRTFIVGPPANSKQISLSNWR
ncbi:MAG: IS200/IS605 family accessory protein TnpB-related protein [Methanosarcinales archaeon]